MRVLLVFQFELEADLVVASGFRRGGATAPGDVLHRSDRTDDRRATDRVPNLSIHATHVAVLREGARTEFVRQITVAAVVDVHH